MRRSIAIVDDEEDVADMLAEVLTERGYTAFPLRSAKACLELVARESIDVVVTDVYMPGMSGIDLCIALRVRDPAPLVIVLTGTNTLEMALEALRAGAYDYVRKPVSLTVLEAVAVRAFQYLEIRDKLRSKWATVASQPHDEPPRN